MQLAIVSRETCVSYGSYGLEHCTCRIHRPFGLFPIGDLPLEHKVVRRNCQVFLNPAFSEVFAKPPEEVNKHCVLYEGCIRRSLFDAFPCFNLAFDASMLDGVGASLHPH